MSAPLERKKVNIAKVSKRFVSSGTIGSAASEVKICGIAITSLGADATVSLYDSQGATLAQKIGSWHFQPGISDFFPVCYYIRDGGYVEITGTAEVFVHSL